VTISFSNNILHHEVSNTSNWSSKTNKTCILQLVWLQLMSCEWMLKRIKYTVIVLWSSVVIFCYKTWLWDKDLTVKENKIWELHTWFVNLC